jgi:hypothetical protein
MTFRLAFSTSLREWALVLRKALLLGGVTYIIIWCQLEVQMSLVVIKPKLTLKT